MGYPSKTMTALICDQMQAGGISMRKATKAPETRRFKAALGFFDPAQVVKHRSKARKKKA